MLLSALARAAGLEHVGDDVEVGGLAIDSRRVAPGDLFVAIAGTRADGLAFVDDARRRGAVAVCASQAVAGLPTIVAQDTRVALGRLSAAWYREPARELRLVGITGTLGKTSTAQLVLSALGASGAGIGVIGSLGVQVRGIDDPELEGRLPDTNAMTTPDAPTLQRALRLLADAGVRIVAMEVTSHALAQRRVETLRLQLGLMTNLVPDEHLEFHASSGDYLRTKAKFFDLLDDDAPIVANADDALVRHMVETVVARCPHPVVWVTEEQHPSAAVRVRDYAADVRGSRFTLDVVRELPRLDGGTVTPMAIPLTLPVLGVQQVGNAALAATAALMAGASPAGLAAAVGRIEPMFRRMQVVRERAPMVLDDTAGNPESLRAVFASIGALPHGTLRVVYGMRGTRGPEINRRLAMTIGGLVAAAACERPVQLVVTACEDAADARNRVLPEEREAFRRALDATRVAYRYEPTLAGAVARLTAEVGAEDLILVLGPQTMDTAGARVVEALSAR